MKKIEKYCLSLTEKKAKFADPLSPVMFKESGDLVGNILASHLSGSGFYSWPEVEKLVVVCPYPIMVSVQNIDQIVYTAFLSHFNPCHDMDLHNVLKTSSTQRNKKKKIIYISSENVYNRKIK